MARAAVDLRLLAAEEGAHARLIAFPHAGASASAYRDWALPADFELWAVQLPARGPLASEPAAPSLAALSDGIVEALRPTLDAGVPFAFFGHSFGAIVAVEAARRLAELGLPTPLTLLLSAHPAPGVAIDVAQAGLSRSRTDEELLEGLRQWDFAPETLDAGDAALRALTVPPIRADLAMREAFCAAAAANEAVGGPPPPRLSMPVHVFGGAEDRSCPPPHLAKWADVAPDGPAAADVADAADAAFSCTLLGGGHFYLAEGAARAALLAHPPHDGAVRAVHHVALAHAHQAERLAPH